MSKGDKHVAPPLALKPESELSDFEVKQLELLKVGPNHPFNVVIERNMEFFNSEGWKEQRRDKVKSQRDKKQTYEIVWKQKVNPVSGKPALLFSVNLPGLKAGTVARMLGDNPEHVPGKDNNLKKIDPLMDNRVDHYYGTNLFLNHSTHRPPIFTVSSREMRGYQSYLCSFTAEQQEKLGIVPRKEVQGMDKKEAQERRKQLHVVAQCAIDFSLFNKDNQIEEEAEKQASEVEKKHVLGTLFHYLVMGQEELDGSLTLVMVIDMDPAGSLPTKLVEVALSGQLDKMKAMVQLCDKEGSVENYLRPYENTREFSSF